MTVNFTTWKGITDGQRYGIPDSDLYYLINEESGDTVFDEIGSNDADSRGTLVWVEADVGHGYYVELDSQNALQVSDLGIIDLSGEFSIGVEIYVTDPLPRGCIFEWGDGSDDFSLGSQNDGRIGVDNDTSTSSGDPRHDEPNTPYNVNLVVTHDDNQEFELYMDEVESIADDGSAFDSNAAGFSIGSSNDPADDRGIDGNGVARFAVWEDEAIDPSEFTL